LKNESSHLLSGAVIRVGNGTGSVGDIGPGHSRLVWLPKGGDATFSIEFSSLGRKHSGCSEYVEGEMNMFQLLVDATLEIDCRPELGIFARRMVLELL